MTEPADQGQRFKIAALDRSGRALFTAYATSERMARKIEQALETRPKCHSVMIIDRQGPEVSPFL